MLYTNLDHIISRDDYQKAIAHENVMICCGAMGPMCIPVYDIMERLRGEYSHVNFFDFEFRTAEAEVIRALPETQGFMGLPFVVYYHNGKVVKATTSIQSEQQVRSILDAQFAQYKK